MSMELAKRKIGLWLLLFYVICSFSNNWHARASWMYLGLSSVGVMHDETCKAVPGLVFKQLEVCENNPESILCISQGARRAIMECQSQFKNERWNCTTNKNQTVFGQIIAKGTKETAFIYAVLSAGVVHAVTLSCSAGNLTACSCDMTQYGDSGVGGWKWGGCSDNIHYGLWFSRTFVDAPETIKHQNSRNVRNRMNLHNNQVGRKVVENLMKHQCRCHGVSGSCSVKTCWRSLPTFREVGLILKNKYEESVQAAPRSRRKLRRKEKTKRKMPITNGELVHINRSPNYCRPDPKKGILGTRGRMCNKTSDGPESCNLLCCGRGYNTQVVRNVERCHCKFIWCCRVECKICTSMTDIHTCK